MLVSPATRHNRRPHDTHGLSHALGRMRTIRQHKTASNSVHKSTSTSMELPIAPLAVVGEEEGLVRILSAADLHVHGEGVPTACGGCGAREPVHCAHLTRLAAVDWLRESRCMLDIGRGDLPRMPCRRTHSICTSGGCALKLASWQSELPKLRPHARPRRRDRGEAPSNPRPTCRIFDFTALFLLFEARPVYIYFLRGETRLHLLFEARPSTFQVPTPTFLRQNVRTPRG